MSDNDHGGMRAIQYGREVRGPTNPPFSVDAAMKGVLNSKSRAIDLTTAKLEPNGLVGSRSGPTSRPTRDGSRQGPRLREEGK